MNTSELQFVPLNKRNYHDTIHGADMPDTYHHIQSMYTCYGTLELAAPENHLADIIPLYLLETTRLMSALSTKPHTRTPTCNGGPHIHMWEDN